MEDVWGNAWAQPEEDVAHSVPTKHKPDDVPSWSVSSATTRKVEEADVGLPSWSTGELNWTEPTGHASLWSSAPTVEDLALEADGWGANSRLDSVPDFAKVTELVDNGTSEMHVGTPEQTQDSIETGDEPSRSSTPDSVGTVTSVVNDETGSPITELASTQAVVSSELDVPESPDGFDSFDEGLAPRATPLDEPKIAWTSPVPAFDDVGGEEDAWGSAWGNPDSSNTNEEEQKDEWTVAREQKARRDRSVPPELLSAIIDRLNDLSGDLWPEKDKLPFEQDLGNWRDGMAIIAGFDAFMQRTLPEVPGQPPIQYSTSQTAKASTKSIKLSKNLPIVRNSPMSHLFTAKSLAAWELTVKSKVEVQKDDIPAGWKVVEPVEQEDSKPTLTEKKSGGILSFFSKRASAVPSPAPTTSGTDSKRSSLSRGVSSDTGSGSTAARHSIDASSHSSKMQQSASVSSLESTPPGGIPSPTTSTFSTKSPPLQSPTSTSSDQTPRSPIESASPPAPSAVSRFLNRFSRTRSDPRSSSLSPRSSLALSTDDLEFLSDIVPSHTDDADEVEQLSSLTAFVSSTALPAKLPPPLAPPPPLVPPPRPSSINRSRTPQSQSLLPSPMLPKGSEPSNLLDTPKSFDSQPHTAKQSAEKLTNNGIAAPALPPALPPPLFPTPIASLSRTSTPSPLSSSGVRAPPSSPSPPAWSSVTSAIPPPKVVIPLRVEPVQRSFSPLNTVVASVGSSSFETPTSTSDAQTLQKTLSPVSPIPPPPIQKSPNRAFVQPSAKLLDDNDDNDFSDFQSHDPSSAHMTRESQPNLPSFFDISFDTSSDKGVSPQDDKREEERLSAFGSFMPNTSLSKGMPVRSPTLPISPTSPSFGPAGVPPPLPKKQPPANINTLHIRKPSAADHDAAARLVERAAARPGRWPAPPSPPPSSSASSKTSTSNQSLLELDYDGVAQAPVAHTPTIALKPIAQITSSAAVPPRIVSPPLLLPPPSSSSSSRLSSNTNVSLLDFEDFSQPAGTHAVKVQMDLPPPALSSGSAKSGLSAQDLSFFEGL